MEAKTLKMERTEHWRGESYTVREFWRPGFQMFIQKESGRIVHGAHIIPGIVCVPTSQGRKAS